MPMHWGFLWADNAEVNGLTHPQACPISKQPELKACAVQLTPIASQPPTAAPTSAEQIMAMVQSPPAVAQPDRDRRSARSGGRPMTDRLND